MFDTRKNSSNTVLTDSTMGSIVLLDMDAIHLSNESHDVVFTYTLLGKITTH